MKNSTLFKWKGRCLLFLLALIPYFSNGQCINSTAYPSDPIPSNNMGQIQELSTCTFVEEYNTVDGLLVGENYIFTVSKEGVAKYVTITTTANVVIAHGVSPLVVNGLAHTAVRLHVSDSSTCSGGTGCHTTTVQFLADCPSPVSLGVTNLSSATATANWTAVGPGTEWDLEYGPTGFVQGTGTLVSDLVATTYNFIDLTPGTTYQFYVRSECATEDSLWSSPFSFTTACLLVTSYSENFESYAGGYESALPNCWSKGGSSWNVYIENLTSQSQKRMYMYGYGSETSPTISYAKMPLVSNLQDGTHRLRFKAYEPYNSGRSVDVGYLTTTEDVASFVLIEEIFLPTGVAEIQEFVVTPGILPAGATRLVFRNKGFLDEEDEPYSTTAYIDDIAWEQIPTCGESIDLLVSDITTSTATFAWTGPTPAPANGYEYYLSTSSANPLASTAGTAVPSANGTEVYLTTLPSNTQHYLWVRSVCGTTDLGIWVGPVAFKTACDPVTEYSQNFDSYAAIYNGSIADCFNKAGNGDVYLYGYTNSPMSTPNALLMSANPLATIPVESYVSLPPVSNLQSGTHRLRFKAYNSYGPETFLEIGYYSIPGDINSFQYLSQVDVLTGVANTQQYSFVPVGLPLGIERLVFKFTNLATPDSEYAEIYIDDVIWEAIPSCSEPSSVTVGSVLATSATIGWTAASPAPAEGYEYYYSTSNVAPGAIPDTTTGTLGSVAAGLTTASFTTTATTTYYVWVRSKCSSTETSIWTLLITFTTPCAAITPDYTENFSTFTWQGPPSCWNKYGAGTLTTGPTGPTNEGNWNEDGFLNQDFTGAAKVNLYYNTNRSWLVSPVFDLNAGGYQVKYKVGATVWGGTASTAMGSDDNVYFMMSTDGGTAWTILETYSATNTPSNLGETKVYNIPAVNTNAVKFAFFATDGTVDDAPDYDFFIDDFQIQTIPVGPPTCSTNVTATPNANCGNESTAISWDASVGSDGYKLTIGTTVGGSEILNNQVVGGLNYSFVGNANTTYYYTVVPFNVNGDATGCVEQSFSTAVNACACTPIYITGVGASDFLSSLVVTGTTLSNNSGTSTTAEPYTLFVGQPNYTATLVEGTTYTFQVTTGYSDQGFAVWIDLNNNLTFEVSERIGATPTTISGTSGSFSVTIPCDAPVGLYRMRVRMVYSTNGDVIDPCSSYNWGETEDYDVTIAELAPPTGDAVQVITVAAIADATIEDLIAVGTGIKWFASEADALANINELTLASLITNGMTYYAVSSAGTCNSAALAVTVTVTLNLDGFDATNFKYYPNPVTDELSLSYSNAISEVIVYNLLGQQMLITKPNATQTQMDLSVLTVGTYLVKVTSDTVTKTVKVIKN